ncbi:MAG: OmpH family outer membrane protein [Candidatus Rhabdochlamydia sp.]
MKKMLFALVCSTLCVAANAAEQKIGVVNFNSCILDSKIGKQEQNAFETMRKQFASLVEDSDKQLRELAEKLQDQDYLDGLSSEAEQNMKVKISELSEDLNRYQQQYYQFMNQGQYKIVQAVVSSIHQASDTVATSKGYQIILNKEACFFYTPTLDVTGDVIKEMDKGFDEEAKKSSSAKTELKGN